MKKFSIISIFVMVAAIVVAVVSCKKDSIQQTTNNTEQSLKDSDNMDEYLMAFKKKLLSAEKGGETISLEQAQRDLGNLLNFDFGDANYATNVLHYDTVYSKLSLTNGQVDYSHLACTYQDLFGQVIDAYHQVNLPEKSVYAISCKFDNSSKEEEIDVITIMVTRAYEESSNYEIEDWRAGNNSGPCEEQYPTNWGAPEEIKDMLVFNTGDWECANGSRVYFTEEGTLWIEAKDEGMYDPNAPHHQKRLYYEYSPLGFINPARICLSHSEIVYYFNQIRLMPTTCQSYFHEDPYPSNYVTFPSDHVVTDYLIKYQENIDFHQVTHGWWKVYFWHGKLNCSSTSPQPNIE